VTARLIESDLVEVTIFNPSRNTQWAFSSCPIGGEEFSGGSWQPSKRFGGQYDCLYPLVIIGPGGVLKETTPYNASGEGFPDLRITMWFAPVGASGSEDGANGRIITSEAFKPVLEN
jgi:hypothetical protein